MKITREELVKEHGEEVIRFLEVHVQQYLMLDLDYAVFKFENAPVGFRNIFNKNGGDEDWLVITRLDPEKECIPSWLYNMSTGQLHPAKAESLSSYLPTTSG